MLLEISQIRYDGGNNRMLESVEVKNLNEFFEALPGMMNKLNGIPKLGSHKRSTYNLTLWNGNSGVTIKQRYIG